jgi:tetratricopeptide (TPR) repeat protein
LPSKAQKQLQKIDQLFIKGNFKEALNIIIANLKKGDLTKEDELRFRILESKVNLWLGNDKKALQLINKVLLEIKKTKNVLIHIDALAQKSHSSLVKMRIDEGIENADKGLKKISTAKKLQDHIIADRKSFLLMMKGMFFTFRGDLAKSIELTQDALSYAEKSGNKLQISGCLANIAIINLHFEKPDKVDEYLEKAYRVAKDIGNKFMMAYCLQHFAVAKNFKREYEEAIKLYEESFKLLDEIGSTFLYANYYEMGNTYQLMFQLDEALECYQKAINYAEFVKHYTFARMGYIYFLKYDLDKAQELYLKSVKMCEKAKDSKTLADVFYNLILISLELKNQEKAQDYLKRLKKISRETDFEYVSQKHLFASLLVLKASDNFNDLGQAAELLKNYLTKKDLPSNLRLDALYALIEIRLKELQLLASEESLKEAEKRLHHLEVEAEEQRYPWMLANVYRLQSQLALIKTNAKEAIKLLQKAQKIASKINVELLKKEIRDEQEIIEKQKSMWKKLQKLKAPLSDTVKLVSFESTIKNIKQKTILEERDEETGKIIEYRKLFALKI